MAAALETEFARRDFRASEINHWIEAAQKIQT
jgi:hypothetical protein